MQSEQVTYYLAGPMSGIPQFNFPKFDRIANELRSAGYTIKSPAEMDDEETRTAALASPDGAAGSASPHGQTWGDFLARDIKLVADEVQGVIAMDGWEKSRGARLEVFVARLCGKSLYVYEGDGRIRPMGDREYLRGITGLTAVLGEGYYGRG